jgi:hypothetical protein
MRRGLIRGLALLAIVVWTLVVFGEIRRVERDPAFCAASCHHDPGARSPGVTAPWHAPGHSGVACQDCHTTPLATGLRLWWDSVAKPRDPAPHGAATPQACVSCHEKRPDEWRIVAETAGHRQHRDVKNVDCLSCHRETSHVAQPPETACLACHKDDRLHRPDVANAETCLSCHGFAASAKNLRPPTPVACDQCHAKSADLIAAGGAEGARPMRDVNAHALHGDVACQLCHNAHKVEPKPPAAGEPVCARCHQLETTQAGSAALVGPEAHRQKCEGCHKPHAPKAMAIQNCVDCHEREAKGVVSSQHGEQVKTTALQHRSCASCHAPHTWKAEPGACADCHKGEARKLSTRSPPQHKACADCHDVHGPPPTGAVCLKCHSDTKGEHVALAPERHKDCTSCHDPHAPKPEDTRASCAKCHQGEAAQLARDAIDGHQRATCVGCHQPHDDPMPQAGACAQCHRERAAVVQTAGPAKHRECAACHEPHQFRVTDVAATCSRCHGPLFDAAARGVADVPHRADCKTCHTFHGEPGVARGACLQCHAKVAAEFHPPNAKHADCGSCHEAHTPAAAAPDRCRACHADKAAVAARWPPASAHAQACNLCHQPHDARVEKACSECHAAEAASALGGKHRCEQCHEPHAPPPGQGAAWWQRCNTCHAAQVQSAQARGPTHSECKNCHQPHEFAVPSCTSCHADIASKGLHAVAQHGNCTNCHDPHVKSVPTRDQCLACHTKQVDHEPAAKQCNTCHIFKP